MREILDQLRAWTAEGRSVALGTVVAVRRGHAGGRLRDASGRIHEVGS